jgi:hypothetical protein
MSGDFIRWKDEVDGRPALLPRELRERAIRMVVESKSEYPSEFATIEAVARSQPWASMASGCHSRQVASRDS